MNRTSLVIMFLALLAAGGLALVVATCEAPPSKGEAPAALPRAGVAPGPDPARAEVDAPVSAPAFVAPVEARLEQRASIGLPEGRTALVVEIGDITREQTLVTVRDAAASIIAGPRSMREGDEMPLALGRESLVLRMTKLENSLLGDDFASITIVPRMEPATGAAGSAVGRSTAATTPVPPPAPIDEKARIEALIADLSGTQGVVFIRNGTEYPPADAADHMRTKWRAAGARVRTAEEFVEHCGSKSTVSGDEYRVRLPDGRTITSREYLLERLRALDAARTPP